MTPCLPTPTGARSTAPTSTPSRALAGALDAEQLSRRVPATPDWTVHDVLAHLAGSPADLLSRPDGRRAVGRPGPRATSTSAPPARPDELVAELRGSVDARGRDARGQRQPGHRLELRGPSRRPARGPRQGRPARADVAAGPRGDRARIARRERRRRRPAYRTTSCSARSSRAARGPRSTAWGTGARPGDARRARASSVRATTTSRSRARTLRPGVAGAEHRSEREASLLASGPSSAGVAHPGGDPVDGQQQRALERRVVLAAAVAAEQLDLQVVQRLEVVLADLQRGAQRRLASSSASSPVTARTPLDGQVVLRPDLVEQRPQLLGRQGATYRSAMSRSVFTSVIETLPRKVRKNGHSAYISCSAVEPRRPRAASPDPTPNQPGTIWRDWVQPKTHGIARRSSRPAPESGRRAGPRADVERAEQVDRRRGEEVLREAGLLDQPAVARVRGRRRCGPSSRPSARPAPAYAGRCGAARSPRRSRRARARGSAGPARAGRTCR